MSNLIKLLQPANYKSKIKLYCKLQKLELKKFSELENKPHIRKIKIETI
jgi:hypothetical protein